MQRSIRSCYSVVLKLDVFLRCSITLYYKMSSKKPQEEHYIRSWNRILSLGFLRFTQKHNFYVFLFPQLAVLLKLTAKSSPSILNQLLIYKRTPLITSLEKFFYEYHLLSSSLVTLWHKVDGLLIIQTQ